MMNINVVLRHELHALINRANPGQLYEALQSDKSPIRDRFIKFLALSYADWLSTQNDIDDDNIKNEWKRALKIKNGTINKNKKNKRNGNNSSNNNINDSPNNSSDSESSLTPPPSPIHNDNGNNIYGSSNNGINNIIINGSNGNKRKLLKEKPILKGFLMLTDRPSPIKIDNDNNNNNINKNDTIIDNEFKNNMDILASPTASILFNNEDIKKQFDVLTIDQQKLLKTKLPLLSDINQLDRRNEILIKKLNLSCVLFNFNTLNSMEKKGIEKKKIILTEILEYIARYAWYNETILQKCIQTISANLFRSIPTVRKNPDLEDEIFEDPAWPHLQLVYDLTLRLVINTDVDKKIMKKYLEGEFVDNIIELFASEDPREREYLKTILHRIYGRFMPLRGFIRQSIANCCYRTIYSNTRSESGIAEFLEIFCSIIHGFSVPVKQEHKEFLRNVLIPLHKCRKLEKFHEQLVACCVQFVFKDPKIAKVILGGLLKFWPVQSPTKEEMFIAEVVNVINAMINHKSGFTWPENRNIALAVIDKLVLCMTSEHHSVAERALLVWGEDAIEVLIDLEKKTIWPKIVKAFLNNKDHWNESLRECNDEAMDVFRVRDSKLFTQIQRDYERTHVSTKKRILNKQEQRQRRFNRWEQLNYTAKQQQSKYKYNHNNNNNYVNSNKKQYEPKWPLHIKRKK